MDLQILEMVCDETKSQSRLQTFRRIPSGASRPPVAAPFVSWMSTWVRWVFQMQMVSQILKFADAKGMPIGPPI
jgi:hypothetical protein